MSSIYPGRVGLNFIALGFTADWTQTNGVTSIVPLNKIVADTTGRFNTGTYKYTAAAKELWDFRFNQAGSPPYAVSAFFWMRRNGATNYQTYVNAGLNVGSFDMARFSRLALNAGDDLSLWLYANAADVTLSAASLEVTLLQLA